MNRKLAVPAAVIALVFAVPLLGIGADAPKRAARMEYKIVYVEPAPGKPSDAADKMTKEFNALSEEDLYNILKLNLQREQKLGAERGLNLVFTEAAMQWMLAQNDEPEYGARPLRRIIRRSVREPLADFLLRANPPAGTQVTIDAGGDGLQFSATVDGKEIKVEAG